MSFGTELALAQATLNTTNPVIFVPILTTFQTLCSNRHFALLSLPDFHGVIFFTGVMLYIILHTKLPCWILLRFPLAI